MVLKKTIGRLFWLIIACHMSFLVAVHSSQAEESAKATTNEKEKKVSSLAQETEGVKGVAVYYAQRYHGRRTTSGQIFDHNKLTAAHPGLPLGTRVKIINLANERSVVVTINDRCRKRSFELIDLTRAAAQKLGFFGKGTARVRIIRLPEE